MHFFIFVYFFIVASLQFILKKKKNTQIFQNVVKMIRQESVVMQSPILVQYRSCPDGTNREVETVVTKDGLPFRSYSHR